MATRKDLEFVQGDDPTADIVVTRDGAVFDLTGRRIEILIKADRYADDTDKILQLSSVGVSPKVTITDALLGEGVANFTDAFAVSGVFWYRAWTALAAAADSDRQTFCYGELRIDPA